MVMLNDLEAVQLSEMVEKLLSKVHWPLDNESVEHGWSKSAVEATREHLEKIGRYLDDAGRVPTPAEVGTGMSRALDFMGVVGGVIGEEVSNVDNALRRLQARADDPGE